MSTRGRGRGLTRSAPTATGSLGSTPDLEPGSYINPQSSESVEQRTSMTPGMCYSIMNMFTWHKLIKKFHFLIIESIFFNTYY